jgi:acetylornithine aminotransferase
MLGVALSEDVAPKVAAAALDAGLIINAVGARTLRIVPPLVITRDDVDEAVQRLGTAFAAVERAEEDA